MKKNLFLLTLLGVVIFGACTKKASPAKVRLMTYTSDIAPLMQAKCGPCHLPSKGGNKDNFENYENAKAHGAEMLERVTKNPEERGFMPKMNPKLSEAEITVIRKWIDAGMLEK